MALQIRTIDPVVLRVRDMVRAGASMIDLIGVDGPLGVILEHLRAHDVAIGEIRERFGAEGNGISIYVRDPEGNAVKLKGPSDGKGPPTK